MLTMLRCPKLCTPKIYFTEYIIVIHTPFSVNMLIFQRPIQTSYTWPWVFLSLQNSPPNVRQFPDMLTGIWFHHLNSRPMFGEVLAEQVWQLLAPSEYMLSGQNSQPLPSTKCIPGLQGGQSSRGLGLGSFAALLRSVRQIWGSNHLYIFLVCNKF